MKQSKERKDFRFNLVMTLADRNNLELLRNHYWKNRQPFQRSINTAGAIIRQLIDAEVKRIGKKE